MRDPERLGDLLFAEADEVAKRDDDPLLVRKLVHGREQLRPALRVEHGRLGGRGRVPRGLCRGGSERETRATSRRAAAVVRLVRDDAEQPRPERRSGAEAAQGAPGLDEAVLGRVLGLGRAACDEERGAECDRLVCVHEFCVGLVVAATSAFDQFDYARALERTERFFWSFCDDYVELVKARAYSDPRGDAAKALISRAISKAFVTQVTILPPKTDQQPKPWSLTTVERASKSFA